MSTRTAALPMERDYLLRAWLVVAGIVIAAAAVIALALSATGSSPSGSTRPAVTRIVDNGPSSGSFAPIRVGDYVCGQCR
jgi:hypothetical protein